MAGSDYDSSDDGIEILDDFVGTSGLASKKLSTGVSQTVSAEGLKDIHSLDEEVSCWPSACPDPLLYSSTTDPRLRR